MIHVHVGAGNFGLGFVVPMFSSVARRSIILNRSPSQRTPSEKVNVQKSIRDRKFYVVSYMDASSDEDQQDIIRVENLYYFDNKKERGEFLSSFSHGENVIFTTSVKEERAISGVCEIIDELRSCIGDGTISVMACENAFTTGKIRDLFVSEYGSYQNVSFIDAIVDRICKEASYDHIADTPHTNVYVEKHKLLVLESKNMSPELIAALSSVPGIIVTPHSSIYRDFKLNVINAAHIFLAGDAQKYGMPLVNVFLTSEETSVSDAPALVERRNHLMTILNELARGTLHLAEIAKYPGDADKITILKGLIEEKHLVEVLDRFSRVEDDVHRILSRLKAPTAEELHTMSDFLRSMLDKVKPPVEGYLNGERVGPPAVTRSFLNIAELIAVRKFVTKFTRH